jgi:hypothetical protein
MFSKAILFCLAKTGSIKVSHYAIWEHYYENLYSMALQVSRKQGPLDNLCTWSSWSQFLISEWTSTWGTHFIHLEVQKTSNMDVVKQQFAILWLIQFVPNCLCELTEETNNNEPPKRPFVY